MSTTTDRIKKILQSWFITEPALSEVIHTHTIIENPDIDTIRSGKRCIEVNPDFISTMNDRILGKYLMFEAVRIILKHPYQRLLPVKSAMFHASNVTVQELLKTDLPYPYAIEMFQDNFDTSKKSLEWYYELILSKLKPSESGDPIDRDNEQNSGSNTQNSLKETMTFEKDEFRNLPESKPGFTINESSTHPAGLWGDDELVTSEINDIIRSHEFSRNSWGSLPGDLKEIIIASAYPQINYKAILKQFMASIISSWVITNRMRPSRRYGLGFPGFKREFVTKLAIFIDVSGSMSSDDIGRGLGLIRGFLIYGVKEIDYYTFDTSIRSKVNSKLIKARTGGFEITGRGGTDFQCIFDLVNSNTEKYDGVIVFTDGIAFSPDIRRESVRKKTLWIFNTVHSHKRAEKHLAGCGKFTHLPDRI